MVRISRRAMRQAQLNTHYESYLKVMAKFIPDGATFVPGDGDVLAPIVFVGEAPGETEDRMGKPFIGKSGNLLSKLLRAVDLTRDDVFITNLVKHRPPGNADPDPVQASAARVLMHWELHLLNPTLVVPLGRFATEVFYPNPSMQGLSGTLRTKDLNVEGGHKLWVMPMYHPSAGLRSANVRAQMYDHIQRLKEV